MVEELPDLMMKAILISGIITGDLNQKVRKNGCTADVPPPGVGALGPALLAFDLNRTERFGDAKHGVSDPGVTGSGLLLELSRREDPLVAVGQCPEARQHQKISQGDIGLERWSTGHGRTPRLKRTLALPILRNC
ncbi:hypothetical protein IC608_01130 [Devosia sp. PTR5]|uniref:Uncharacterized protein n=1 Tax=Devosia oryzisoli TaxID=2774138 RepID=A0A927FSD5_9HYPH|nr:hypothetical protein [Devosia oryzisoli]MBD8064078.1 hypothetical protein [Devosia oryzisoli]